MWLFYFLINGKIKQNIWINHNFLWAILETISFPRIITPFWCRKKNQLTPLAIIWENTVSVLRRKFSSTGGKAPGYRLSPDHFQTVKQMLAPDWAQKMLCIIVPNRRTVSPEFFSWVVHDGYCLDHGLSGSCTKEMHAVRKLSVWYKLSISKYCLPENYRCFSKNTSLSLQQVFTLASIMPS